MACLFRRSNGIFYLAVSRNGKRIWRSTRFRTREEAETIASRDFADLVRPIRQETLSHFEAAFLHYAHANYAPGTIDSYRRSINSFINAAGDRRLTLYTVRDVDGFKATRGAMVSPTSVNIELSALKALFQIAVRWGYIKANPFAGVKKLRVIHDHPLFLTRSDFDALLNAISVSWFKDIVRFAVCTMMRVGEIVNLKWTSIDMTRKLIQVHNQFGYRLKTPYPHAVPMNTWVFKYLDAQDDREGHVFSQANGDPFTRNHVSRLFCRFSRKAGLDKGLHFHSLRHGGFLACPERSPIV